MRLQVLRFPAIARSLTALLFISLSTHALATEVLVETDPSTFALKGYAGHVRVRPGDSGSEGRWIFGFGAYGYGTGFPKAMRELAISGPTDSAELHLQHGYAIFADAFLGDLPGQGWFAGMEIARQGWSLRDRNAFNAAVDYSTTVLMPRVGYQYNFPQSVWYVVPWFGVGYVAAGRRDLDFGTDSYRPKAVLPFGALHVGVRF